MSTITGPTFSSSSSTVNPATLMPYVVTPLRPVINAVVALPPNTLTEPESYKKCIEIIDNLVMYIIEILLRA